MSEIKPWQERWFALDARHASHRACMGEEIAELRARITELEAAQPAVPEGMVLINQDLLKLARW